jgi:hypothetical protein
MFIMSQYKGWISKEAAFYNINKFQSWTLSLQIIPVLVCPFFGVFWRSTAEAVFFFVENQQS